MAPKVKTIKNSQLPKMPENCFESVGKGGWPMIYTWINPLSLGNNGLHCIECPGEREKRLLNLHLDELLSLLKVVTKLWLEGLDLFNQSGYMRFLCAEGIFTLCCNLVHLLLLDKKCLGRGCSACSILLFTF
jgi:hypothetical protein